MMRIAYDLKRFFLVFELEYFDADLKVRVIPPNLRHQRSINHALPVFFSVLMSAIA